jgi:hypothetical protein
MQKGNNEKNRLSTKYESPPPLNWSNFEGSSMPRIGTEN